MSNPSADSLSKSEMGLNDVSGIRVKDPVYSGTEVQNTKYLYSRMCRALNTGVTQYRMQTLIGCLQHGWMFHLSFLGALKR